MSNEEIAKEITLKIFKDMTPHYNSAATYPVIPAREVSQSLIVEALNQKDSRIEELKRDLEKAKKLLKQKGYLNEVWERNEKIAELETLLYSENTAEWKSAAFQKIRGLETEIERLKNRTIADHLHPALVILENKIKELESQLKICRELVTFGNHKKECNWWRDDGPCNCGHKEALTSTAPQSGEAKNE